MPAAKKMFYPAIYNAEKKQYECVTPYPYSEEFTKFGEVWVLHRTPYNPEAPANNWRISHEKYGVCVFSHPYKTKEDARNAFFFYTLPKKPGVTPEEYVKKALERTKQILYPHIKNAMKWTD